MCAPPFSAGTGHRLVPLPGRLGVRLFCREGAECSWAELEWSLGESRWRKFMRPINIPQASIQAQPRCISCRASHLSLLWNCRCFPDRWVFLYIFLIFIFGTERRPDKTAKVPSWCLPGEMKAHLPVKVSAGGGPGPLSSRQTAGAPLPGALRAPCPLRVTWRGQRLSVSTAARKPESGVGRGPGLSRHRCSGRHRPL